MQNEAANKKIEMLFPKSDPLDEMLSLTSNSPPLIVQQIQDVQHHLVFGMSQGLSDLLFQDVENQKKPACCMKSIGTWNEKDILEWSNAFRKQADTRKLVEEHLCEVTAIISRAVYLEKGFYPPTCNIWRY